MTRDSEELRMAYQRRVSEKARVLGEIRRSAYEHLNEKEIHHAAILHPSHLRCLSNTRP